MGRKIVLQKCEEHEHCQLESVDDGPWMHTPDDAEIGERFPEWPPTPGEVERDISDSVLMAQFDKFAETVVSVTPKVETLEGKVERIANDVQALDTSRRAAEQALVHSASATDDNLKRLFREVDVLRNEVRNLSETVSASVVGAEGAMQRLAARAQELEVGEKVVRRVVALEKAMVHERQERLDNTRKFLRSIRTVAELAEK